MERSCEKPVAESIQSEGSRNVNPFLDCKRLPCLDGWRAIAILLVLGAHSEEVAGFPASWKPTLKWICDGALGVRFFFVISGFLITLLMLREDSTRGFSLRSFWIRRSLRILPVYFVFLLTLAVLQQCTLWRMSTAEWIRAASFTYNYDVGQWLPGHLWSLCVEEQFYLLWPLTYLAIRDRRAIGVSLFVVVLGTAAVCRTMGYLTQYPTFLGRYALPLHVDSLAIGCVLAYLARRFGGLQTGLVMTLTGLVVACVAILVPHVLLRLLSHGAFTIPFGPMSQATGFGIMLWISIKNHSKWPWRYLDNPSLVGVGVLSYSLYIWQQVFCTSTTTFGYPELLGFSFPAWIVMTYITALVSYLLIEKPMLRLKGRLAPR